jgi:hypothetical protein
VDHEVTSWGALIVKSKTMLWLLAAVVTAVAAGIFSYVQYKNRQPEKANSVFSISDEDLPKLKADARAGDCEAAFKIGQYHTFVTLDIAEAIVWMRMASPCKSIPAKETLVAFLLEDEDQSKVSKEIDQLLEELQQLDEKAAKRARDQVLLRRGQAR